MSIIQLIVYDSSLFSAIGAGGTPGVDNQCEISKRGFSNTKKVITSRSCQVQSTPTGFWIKIKVAEKQISIGKEGAEFNFLNLYDPSSDGHKIADIQHIGFKSAQTDGAIWNISTFCIIGKSFNIKMEIFQNQFKMFNTHD